MPDGTDLYLQTLGPEHKDRRFVEEMMIKTIRPHKGDSGGTFSTYRVQSVQRVQNRRLWDL